MLLYFKLYEKSNVDTGLSFNMKKCNRLAFSSQSYTLTVVL